MSTFFLKFDESFYLWDFPFVFTYSFMITQYAHRCSKDVRVTLEIYDWNSGKRIAVVEDAVLTRTRYE